MSVPPPNTPTSTPTPIPTPTRTPETITVDLPGLPQGAIPLVLVRIRAGSFQMGSNDDSSWSWCPSCEQPVHTVDIGYDFYIGKYEVTQAQWHALIERTPPSDYGVGDDYPVYNVSWNDCQSFITALNSLKKGTFRLPSEAEWEYACRSGSTTRFCFGDSTCSPSGCTSCELDAYARWCGNNDPYGSKPVGGKLPNAWGLYDMHGNVWEWCQDWWHDGYTGAPSDGSAWESPDDIYRVLRGGSWGDPPWYCRSANRYWDIPTYRFINNGFRLVGVVSEH
jgi:formylglycine-generating enzyme required for sulfatase activity